MIMAPPALTPEQREQALAASKLARSERSAALADLEKGAVSLADFLARDDEVVKRTRIRQALLKLRGVGPKTADAALAKARVANPKTKRIGSLGRNQRDALVEFFAAP
jgi:hypothetical protein